MINPLIRPRTSYRFLYSEVNTNHHGLIKAFYEKSLQHNSTICRSVNITGLGQFNIDKFVCVTFTEI